MKNQFALAVMTVLLSVSAYSQDHERDRIIDVLNEYALNKQLKYEPSKTMGSPYLNKMFAPAKVGNVPKNAMMRYDVFNDEFEFVDSKRDTLVLNKTEAFSQITFTVTNTKYQLVNYTNKKGEETNGYLIWLYEKNGFTLYKKQTINYTAAQTSDRPFEPSSPAKFEQAKDIFYFKNGDKGIELFPTNKKGLIKLFPEKKAAIETFVKQNDIDFDKDADKMKILDFLAV